MNCREWQERWQAHLDGDGPVHDQAWRAHLKACPDCRFLHEAAPRVHDLLRQAPPPAVPAGFADRVVAGHFRQRRQELRRRWFAGGALAAAAAVLLAVLLRPPAPPADLTVQSRPAPVAPKSVPPPSLRDQIQEARVATLDLTRKVAEDAARLVPPAERLVPVSLNLPPTPTPPVRHVGQAVSEDLAPVTDSARRAFHLFQKMLPPAVEAKASGL